MLWWLATALTILVLAPTLVVVVECLVARRRLAGSVAVIPQHGVRTVVCIPAHDEEEELELALASVAGQLGPEDRILVVAHNCSDATATCGRRHGAEVLELNDGLDGKVHALNYATLHLRSDPPEVVVVIDADVRADPGAIQTLVAAAWQRQRPVQGRYLFEPLEGSALTRGSFLAILLKNEIRFLGRHRLGLPVPLNGAGWAIPFALLQAIPMRHEAMAEDYRFTVDLLLRGVTVDALPEAVVRTAMPRRASTALQQRRRWEHGHLRLALTVAPVLFLRMLWRLDFRAASLALHLLVPPLALLCWFWLLAVAVAVLAWFTTGEMTPMILNLLSGTLALTTVGLSIRRFVGWRATLDGLRCLPHYVAVKIPIYTRFLFDRQKRWLRTDRDRSA